MADTTLDSGHMSILLQIPEATEFHILVEQRLESGTLLVYVDASRKLTILLLSDEKTERVGRKTRRQQKVLSATMTPLLIGHNDFILSISWRQRRFVDARVNNVRFWQTWGHCTIPGYILLWRLQNNNPVSDFTEQNQLARERRKHTLGGRHPKANRTPGGREYAFKSLEHEALQLADLMELAEAGKEHHILGIAARLRLLLTERRMGLLQTCAAYLDMPLIIYASEPQPLPTDFEIAIFVAATAEPALMTNVPIDVDVWLDTEAVRYRDRSYTCRELIKDIGDTIGSHRDLDITPLAEGLMRTPGVFSHYNDVTRFIRTAGALTLSLANQVIQKNSE